MSQRPILLYLLTALIIGLCLIGPILSARGENSNTSSEDEDMYSEEDEDWYAEDTYTDDEDLYAEDEDLYAEDMYTDDEDLYAEDEDLYAEDMYTDDEDLYAEDEDLYAEDMYTDDEDLYADEEDLSAEDMYTDDEDLYADEEDTSTDDTSTDDWYTDDTSVDDTEIMDTTIADTSTSIPTPAPPLAVTSPIGGENWVTGATQTITWTSNGVTGVVRVQLSRDGGATWITIFYCNTSDGSHAWRVSGPATSSAKIRVVSAGNSAVFGTSDDYFTISSL